MGEPTDSDRRLLQTILTLTEQNMGRPPTLAEVTETLGFQSSSRANIQRQLSRLRPTYVDWTSSPRSLRVTENGMGLLGVPSAGTDLDLPISDAILPLLASGLTKLVNDLNETKPLQAPYPAAWRRGMNLLAAEFLQRDLDPPASTAAAVALCHQRPSSWPVRFSGLIRLGDQSLLEDEQPTELCHELAQKGDAELEIHEKLMEQVLTTAQAHRRPDAYVALRQLLIQEPVLPLSTLLERSFSVAIGPLGPHLNELFEPVPTTTLTEEGEVLLCGFCGWTLERLRGRLRCGDDRCRVLTENFIRGTHVLRVSPDTHLHRVRRAIRRYVVAPGKYEVATAGQLQALGCLVELWPGYDAYDLRITFPDGEVWAVDVKDWRFPHLLAPHIRPLSQSSSWHWTRAFYAIPDARVSDIPNYISFLQSAVPSQEFTILTISALLEAVQTRKETLDAQG